MTLVNVPDVEEILVTDIRDYIDNDVSFQAIYPSFGYPNVTQEHPFAVKVYTRVENFLLAGSASR